MLRKSQIKDHKNLNWQIQKCKIIVLFVRAIVMKIQMFEENPGGHLGEYKRRRYVLIVFFFFFFFFAPIWCR